MNNAPGDATRAKNACMCVFKKRSSSVLLPVLLRGLFHGAQPHLQILLHLGSLRVRIDLRDDLGHGDFKTGGGLSAQNDRSHEVVGQADEFVLQVEVLVFPVD